MHQDAPAIGFVYGNVAHQLLLFGLGAGLDAVGLAAAGPIVGGEAGREFAFDWHQFVFLLASVGGRGDQAEGRVSDLQRGFRMEATNEQKNNIN